MYKRRLTGLEVSVAKGVFWNTLPYGKIWVTEKIGLKDRPYTMPDGGGFYLNVGSKAGFNKTKTPLLPRSLLIHELTHVWQGHNSNWSWSYIFNSIEYQARLGDNAYKYIAGKPWDAYNVEQQAQIVEDWFRKGQRTKDLLFIYIQGHIRKAKRPKRPNFDHIY